MLIKIPTVSTEDHQLTWSQLQGCSLSCAADELIKSSQRPHLLITPTVQIAEQLIRELEFFSEGRYPVLRFPDWETLPYDHFSPHEDIVSERLRTLYQLPNLKHGVVVCSITTLLHHLLPSDFLHQHTLFLENGQQMDFEKYRHQLVANGYRAVGQVMTHGEFAYRGSILDVFPMGMNQPLRIELFDNEIETIRCFDPETQRSSEKLNQIELLPAEEFPLDEAGITHFRQSWREHFSGNPLNSSIYQQISDGQAAAGSEYYLSLFYDKLASIFDYLPKETTLLFAGDCQQSADQFWAEVNERYDQLAHDIERPICKPAEIYLSVTDFYTQAKDFLQVKLFSKKISGSQFTADTAPLPDLQVESKKAQPLEKLQQFLSQTDRVLFCAESTGRRETLIDLFRTADIKPQVLHSWSDFLKSKTPLTIIVAPLDKGCILPESKTAIICENDLFGEQVQQRRLRKASQIDPDLMIRNLSELSVGAPVVHLEHGVARYLGLETITSGGIEAEYLALEYAEKAKIYVPVSSLHMISRYTGMNSEHAPLNKLGTNKWSREKQKAYEKIRDTAAELLDIYSRREASKGFAFKMPDIDYIRFAQSFAFETTPDQQKAIDDVLKDMTRDRTMDRLVCGDVGFGKTEVAMRAAFLAAQNSKQTAILVPTTLLAAQHAQNFQDRFADWPVKVAVLSRLNTAKQTEQILKDLAAGRVDIVVGTHKLLSGSIKFKDLGLLIIDEEHRFGVRQKDKIKALAVNIDILTLTATPIPRTLNFALAGTRDLSIIGTPPPKRRSIKTFIHEHSSSLTREAVMREILRGGQVYILHNKVENIEATTMQLRELLPEAKITFAHGQMHEREMERVMSDFYHQKFNVLVSTTIIESGIDVPTANTILINRADKFGLAQLHQLRGRVGRSHHQAYAYLFTPPWKAITSDAKRRLEAFEKLGDLGIGFSLATHDLEIRGAGEMLGDEQSGHMQAIGFSLYMELLSDAVKSLKEGKEPQLDKSTFDSEIKLGVSALFPENYVNDVHLRLTLYKRLASCKNKDEMQSLKGEMIDRFGMLPEPAQSCFTIAKLKLKALELGISKIEFAKNFGYIHFNAKPNIDPMKIIKLVQLYPKIYQLQGPQKLRITHKAETLAQKIELIDKVVL